MNDEKRKILKKLEVGTTYSGVDVICRQYKEIERLNNIINEFDKWLDEESEKTILSTGHLTCLMMCKNKLQELKGSDKE